MLPKKDDNNDEIIASLSNEALIDIKPIYDMCVAKAAEAEKYSASHNGDVDPKLLEVLDAGFGPILKFETKHLITAHDTFYGSMLMNMDMAIDFTQRGPVDIILKSDPFVMSFNPIYCCKYSYPQFTGLVVKEILALAFAHPATYAELNSTKDEWKHKLLDYASDASLSSMVQHDIRLSSSNKGLRLPKDSYTVSKLNNECKVTPKDNESMDYYFKILEKFKKKDPGDTGNSSDNGGEGGEGSGDSKPDGKKAATPNNSNGHTTHDWEGGDPEDQKESIKAMVSEAYNSMSDKSRGFMPGGLISQIEKLLAPPQIDWKRVTKHMIGSVPVPYRKTKTRLNRRQPYRSDLSGKLPKRLVEIVVCIDTSGSMSDKDISYVLSEILNMVKGLETKITIIECDAEINRVYTVKKLSDVKDGVGGRGGTSYVPAIEFINGVGDLANKKEYKGVSGNFKHAVMVYFTDGYGDSSIPRPKTYRNIWVITGGDSKNLSLDNPYGAVMSINTDKDFVRYKKSL